MNATDVHVAPLSFCHLAVDSRREHRFDDAVSTSVPSRHTCSMTLDTENRAVHTMTPLSITILDNVNTFSFTFLVNCRVSTLQDGHDVAAALDGHAPW